jgi:hypothetical protein
MNDKSRKTNHLSILLQGKLNSQMGPHLTTHKISREMIRIKAASEESFSVLVSATFRHIWKWKLTL